LVSAKVLLLHDTADFVNVHAVMLAKALWSLVCRFELGHLMTKQFRKLGHDIQATGIKKGCLFNELKYWQVTENSIVDVMHDILEGIAPFELCFVLGEIEAA
jgi:hypothetical protein